MLGLSIPLIIIGATIALSWPLGRYMRWAMDAELFVADRQFDGPL